MPILIRLGMVLAIVLLTACGEGYVVEPARLNLVNATAESKTALIQEVSALLANEGFEDLGRDVGMIELLKKDPASRNDSMVERLSRQHTYLNQSGELRVVLSDYTDGSPMPDGDYTPKTSNFIEIRFSESRPGGASPEGRRVFQHLHTGLSARFGDDIVVVNDLPPTNQAEYRRITRVNQQTTVLWWCIAFFVSLLITAPISRHFIAKTRLPILPQRAIFTAVNTWLVTPIMLPASIMVVIVPNVFAFPWIYPELYAFRAAFNLASFPWSLVLCAAASALLIKDRKAPSRPA